jgi:multidrug efflux pump subunit AcrA (membrane-fusion protein)
MAEETIDPGLLEQTKNQIRKLVSEIADLAEADLQPAEFHVEFLNRVVAAVAATGGALWLLDGRGSLKLQHQLEFRQTGLLDGKVRTQPHDALLGCMIQASSAQIIPPGATVEGVPQAGNPTPFSLILAPILVDKQPVGIVEILMDPTRRAAHQKSTLRFVGDLCDLAAQYLKNRQMRQVMSQQRLWNQLESFTHAIHSSLDLKETAYAVANEGKRLVGVDRLSVVLKAGGRSIVEAISGQEIVEQRANLVREMTRLAKAVIASGEDLVYTGSIEGFPPEIRDALEIYVDESGSKAVIITILHKPDAETEKDKEKGKQAEKVPIGCLIAEQIGDELAPTDAQARTEVVARHASTALFNAAETDKIFLRPVLKAIGSPKRFFRGRTLAKIGAVLAGIATLIGIMAFVPWQLTIEGRGSLLPEDRRIVYAPWQAVVAQVPVGHGQAVKKGDLLVQLESKELDKELKKALAMLAEASDRLRYLQSQDSRPGLRPEDRAQIKGEMAEYEIKLKGATEQQAILKEQIEMLTVRSPLDGIVTSPFEPQKELLGRPVEVGQELVQVASTEGDWIELVEVPDNDMGPVLAAQSRLEREVAAARAAGREPARTSLPAYFVSATDPQHRYYGSVKRIGSKAETVEGKHVVKVEVVFPPEVRQAFLLRNQALRPGAEVRARIMCGDARLAYVLFRDVIHVWHETVLFRWPFLRG